MSLNSNMTLRHSSNRHRPLVENKRPEHGKIEPRQKSDGCKKLEKLRQLHNELCNLHDMDCVLKSMKIYKDETRVTQASRTKGEEKTRRHLLKKTSNNKENLDVLKFEREVEIYEDETGVTQTNRRNSNEKTQRLKKRSKTVDKENLDITKLEHEIANCNRCFENLSKLKKYENLYIEAICKIQKTLTKIEKVNFLQRKVQFSETSTTRYYDNKHHCNEIEVKTESKQEVKSETTIPRYPKSDFKTEENSLNELAPASMIKTLTKHLADYPKRKMIEWEFCGGEITNDKVVQKIKAIQGRKHYILEQHHVTQANEHEHEIKANRKPKHNLLERKIARNPEEVKIKPKHNLWQQSHTIPKYETKVTHEESKAKPKQQNYVEHKCETCWKSFVTERSLAAHIKMHLGYKVEPKVKFKYHSIRDGRPFHCTKCDKSFRAEHLLEKHTRKTHEPDNVYKCEFCGESDRNFSRKTRLLEHMSQHSKM